MSVKKVEFPNLSEAKGARLDPSTFSNIPIKISVELGETEMSLKEVLELSEGSIVELSRLAGEPLDLKVGDELIAKGEVVAVDNNYGLRITSVNLNR
jgi:flagellar motor switch protein FliN/FliY